MNLNSLILSISLAMAAAAPAGAVESRNSTTDWFR
jgi:hypothetical protein